MSIAVCQRTGQVAVTIPDEAMRASRKTCVRNSWPMTALNKALFGLFTYATYDLTNYATLKDWTAALAVSDIAWGMVTTAVVALS